MILQLLSYQLPGNKRKERVNEKEKKHSKNAKRRQWIREKNKMVRCKEKSQKKLQDCN